MKKWFFALVLILLLWKTADAITGDATTQNIVITINITTAPFLSVISPENETYLKNEIVLNFSTNGDSAWYSLDGNANVSVSSFTILNVSEGSHTLYVYANNSQGVTSKKVEFSVNLSRVNILYNEYNDSKIKGNSTDFREFSYEDLQQLKGIILENTLFGKISFLEVINLTADATPEDNIIDIDSYVNISFNRIEINATGLPNFNKSATLFLYNLTFSNPRILRDGSPCNETICVFESYSDGTLRFNVTGFSVYSAEETPLEVSQPTPSGSGGGGGKKRIRSFTVFPEDIKVSLKQGETKREFLEIENTGNEELLMKISVSDIENLVKISKSSFTLGQNSKEKITLDFIAPENSRPDIYLGRVLIKPVLYESLEKEVLIAVNILPKIVRFSISLSLEERVVRPGDNLIADISVYNLEEAVSNATLSYFIKDFDNRTILFQKEQIVFGKTKVLTKKFRLPENTSKGKYVFYVRINYDSQSVGTAEVFYVEEKGLFETYSVYILLAIAFIMLLIVIIVLLMEYELHHKRRKKRR